MTHARLCHVARLLVLLTGATIIGGLCASLCVIGSYPLLLPTPLEAPRNPDEPVAIAAATDALAVVVATDDPLGLTQSAITIRFNDRGLVAGPASTPSTTH